MSSVVCAHWRCCRLCFWSVRRGFVHTGKYIKGIGVEVHSASLQTLHSGRHGVTLFTLLRTAVITRSNWQMPTLKCYKTALTRCTLLSPLINTTNFNTRIVTSRCLADVAMDRARDRAWQHLAIAAVSTCHCANLCLLKYTMQWVCCKPHVHQSTTALFYEGLCFMKAVASGV